MAVDSNGEAPVVSLVDVHKVYQHGQPVPVLSGLSCAIDAGSFTAIMGPSGSGKSTLLNLIGCLDLPTAGTVRIMGHDVSALTDDERASLRGRQLGFVFQSFNLVPTLTATENVALPLVFQGVSRAERQARADELLTEVGLEHRGDHRPNDLSGGQRQRVAIARALAGEPSILLADEPTGSLDSETERRIMGLFERIHEAGNTVILVTHARPIAEYAGEIIHVLDGDIEAIEPVDERRSDASGDDE